MATIDATKSGAQPKGLRVGLVSVSRTYSLTVSMSAGDVIQMINVPKNATPIYVRLSHTGLTAVGSANVGDGISTSRYISNYAFSAGAIDAVINTRYPGYTYSTDDTIDIQISALSVSTLAGAWNLTAIFSMDPT